MKIKILLLLSYIIIMIVWTVFRYYSRIKGEFYFSFKYLFLEVHNSFLCLGTKEIYYEGTRKE